MNYFLIVVLDCSLGYSLEIWIFSFQKWHFEFDLVFEGFYKWHFEFDLVVEVYYVRLTLIIYEHLG